MQTYEILDGDGNVINTIVADQSFVDAHFEGRYRAQEMEVGGVAESEPSWVISKHAFIKRVGADYWLDLEDATPSSRDLRKLMLIWNNSSVVDLKNEDIAKGVQIALDPNAPAALRKTAEEVDAVLGVPCQPGEEP